MSSQSVPDGRLIMILALPCIQRNASPVQDITSCPAWNSERGDRLGAIRPNQATRARRRPVAVGPANSLRRSPSGRHPDPSRIETVRLAGGQVARDDMDPCVRVGTGRPMIGDGADVPGAVAARSVPPSHPLHDSGRWRHQGAPAGWWCHCVCNHACGSRQGPVAGPGCRGRGRCVRPGARIRIFPSTRRRAAGSGGVMENPTTSWAPDPQGRWAGPGVVGDRARSMMARQTCFRGLRGPW